MPAVHTDISYPPDSVPDEAVLVSNGGDQE